jgi:hypothetical protein
MRAPSAAPAGAAREGGSDGWRRGGDDRCGDEGDDGARQCGTRPRRSEPGTGADRLLDDARREVRQHESEPDAHGRQRDAVEAGALRREPEEQGPVVEVDRVRPPAEPPQLAPRQHARHEGAVVTSGGDHDRDETRVGHEPSGVEPAVGLRRRRPRREQERERSERDPAEDPAITSELWSGGDGDRQERADEQLGRPDVRAVVGAQLIVDEQRRHQRPGEPEAQRDGDAAPPSATERQRADHHQGEEDVQLLLDGEAPEVLHRRRRRPEVAVGRAGEHEAPVGDVPERGEHVAAERPEL